RSRVQPPDGDRSPRARHHRPDARRRCRGGGEVAGSVYPASRPTTTMTGMPVTSSETRSAGGASLRALKRQLATLVPGSQPPGAAGEGPSLEVLTNTTELPRLIGAGVIEGRSLRARAVPDGACF